MIARIHTICSLTVFAILLRLTIQNLFTVFDAYDEFAAGIRVTTNADADAYLHISTVMLLSCSAAWVVECLFDHPAEKAWWRSGLWAPVLMVSALLFNSALDWTLWLPLALSLATSLYQLVTRLGRRSLSYR